LPVASACIGLQIEPFFNIFGALTAGTEKLVIVYYYSSLSRNKWRSSNKSVKRLV
jgi:hypothetical protein